MGERDPTGSQTSTGVAKNDCRYLGGFPGTRKGPYGASRGLFGVLFRGALEGAPQGFFQGLLGGTFKGAFQRSLSRGPSTEHPS